MYCYTLVNFDAGKYGYAFFDTSTMAYKHGFLWNTFMFSISTMFFLRRLPSHSTCVYNMSMLDNLDIKRCMKDLTISAEETKYRLASSLTIDTSTRILEKVYQLSSWACRQLRDKVFHEVEVHCASFFSESFKVCASSLSCIGLRNATRLWKKHNDPNKWLAGVFESNILALRTKQFWRGRQCYVYKNNIGIIKYNSKHL